MAKRAFAWSYSALTRFENCPKQYYEINLTKNFKDEDSEFAAEGKLIHDSMFNRVLKNTPLPLQLRPFEATAAKFAAADGEKHGEMKLALNRDFQPRDFFAPDVYVRVVVDLLIIRGTQAIIVDWKTGKPKDDFTQLKLTAAVLKHYMPELDFFKLLFVWLKHNKVSPKTATNSKLTETWNELLPRVGKIEEAIKTTSFPAKPSGLCKWCPVRTCPHFGERD